MFLTDISYFISHHVFVVVDSGKWNIGLVCHWDDVEFLKKERSVNTIFFLNSGNHLQEFHVSHVASYYLDADMLLRRVE